MMKTLAMEYGRRVRGKPSLGSPWVTLSEDWTLISRAERGANMFGQRLIWPEVAKAEGRTGWKRETPEEHRPPA